MWLIPLLLAYRLSTCAVILFRSYRFYFMDRNRTIVDLSYTIQMSRPARSATSTKHSLHGPNRTVPPSPGPAY